MWYRLKVLRIRYNLVAGTDTLLLGGPSPQFGGGGRARGSGVAPRKSPRIRLKNLAGTEMLSLSVYESIAK